MDYIERYEEWVWVDNFAVIDTLKDGQVIKVFKTSRGAANCVARLNHEYNSNI